MSQLRDDLDSIRHRGRHLHDADPAAEHRFRGEQSVLGRSDPDGRNDSDLLDTCANFLSRHGPRFPGSYISWHEDHYDILAFGFLNRGENNEFEA